MRMGSSSLSSESCVPRAGWGLSPPAASSVGSDLLQPPDVSSVASGSIVSVAAEAIDPPWRDLPAELDTDELPTSLEQEASHCCSVMGAVLHRCPEDSQGAEANRNNEHNHISTCRYAAELFFKLVVCDFSPACSWKHSPGSDPELSRVCAVTAWPALGSPPLRELDGLLLLWRETQRSVPACNFFFNGNKMRHLECKHWSSCHGIQTDEDSWQSVQNL